MNPFNDPDVKVARQELLQDQRIARAAESEGTSAKAFAAKHGLPYTGAERTEPSPLWAVGPMMFAAFIAMWAIAGAATAARWVGSFLPLTMPAWLGSAITAMAWPTMVLGAAFGLHRLRQRFPYLYAVAVFSATGAISWAIVGGGLPQQLSLSQLMAILGAVLSAVDGFNVLEARRAAKVSGTSN